MLDGTIAGAVVERADLRDVEPAAPAARVLQREPRDEAHRRGGASRRIGRGKDLAVGTLRRCGSRSIRSAQDDYLAAVDRWLAHFGVKAPNGARCRRAHARSAAVPRSSADRAAAASRGSSRVMAGGLTEAPQVSAAVPSRVDARPRLQPDRAVIAERCRSRRSGGDPARPMARVLLAQRPVGQGVRRLLGVPGGKLEPGETPARRSSRELREELGIVGAHGRTVARAGVRLPARARRAQLLPRLRARSTASPRVTTAGAFAWQDPHAITVAPLLPANTRVLAALTLLRRFMRSHVRAIRARTPRRARRAGRCRRHSAGADPRTRSVIARDARNAPRSAIEPCPWRGAGQRQRRRCALGWLLQACTDRADAPRRKGAPARSRRRRVVPHAQRSPMQAHSTSILPSWVPCSQHRRIPMHVRSAGPDLRRRSRGHVCPCSHSAACRHRISRPRSRMVLTASRCAGTWPDD